MDNQLDGLIQILEYLFGTYLIIIVIIAVVSLIIRISIILEYFRLCKNVEQIEEENRQIQQQLQQTNKILHGIYVKLDKNEKNKNSSEEKVKEFN